jgi:hypothetical protein
MLYVPAIPGALDNYSSEVVVVGQPGASLDFLSADAGWRVPEARGAAVWTDDRSDILSRIRWR